MSNDMFREMCVPLPAEDLFDELPNVVFFVKDRAGRYVVVNQTLVERCGAKHKGSLVGRMPAEVFPTELGMRYQKQDETVLRTGRPVVNRLEMHLYKGRQPGWCLTTKRPLRGKGGGICGIIGLSRDVHEPGQKSPEYSELSAALDFMYESFSSVLRIGDLAKRAGLSPHQFDLRVRRLMHMSPMQLLQKIRIDEAARLLAATDLSLAQIAAEVGYCDQSALNRQFRALVGLTPGQFRHNPR